MNELTIKDVLTAWRKDVRFADEVRFSDGRRGNLIRRDKDGSLVVLIGRYGAKATQRAVTVQLSALFPGWWPDKAFTK